MASDPDFIEFVTDQINRAGKISHRKMFGEYVIYCDNKVVALVCDNRLYVKPTDAGRRFIGKAVEAPAYPGAKQSFLIGDKIEDNKWIGDLIKITASELPESKPKKRTGRKK